MPIIKPYVLLLFKMFYANKVLVIQLCCFLILCMTSHANFQQVKILDEMGVAQTTRIEQQALFDQIYSKLQEEYPKEEVTTLLRGYQTHQSKLFVCFYIAIVCSEKISI
jgi:hypothetical protein